MRPRRVLARERLRLLLDADMSSHGLVRILHASAHDVVAAGLRDDLKQLDDDILFNIAQQERRVMITQNTADFPDILVAWAHAGLSHHGCILSHCPGHQRWPNDVPLFWSEALGRYVTVPEDDR